ncbi:MAG: undecaprenyl/decaprenyl-phosphate alpha-N-acetylglucosaminyl 1-phosphate transferase [Bacteroidales bacterium]|nr:undecaprenyl/decaprenyl-phosphate alpha-N-acetylglucosaminyl 1-phosphate transferase [Bacteroidales bacterium]
MIFEMHFSILWYIPIFVLSLVFVAIVIPAIVSVADKIHLYDTQDGRKVHQGEVPRLGGIAFLPAILFTLLAVLAIMTRFLPESLHVTYAPITEIMMAAAGCVLLYLVGIMDDVIGVSYRSKFIVQFLAAVLLCCSGLYISDLHGVFGIRSVSPFIGVPLTVLITVFIINSINLIDGIDGLASGLCIFSVLGFAVMFHKLTMAMNLVLAMSMLGVLVMFYLYNTLGKRGKTKIFMGDTGSLTMGFLLAFFTIELCCFKWDRVDLALLGKTEPFYTGDQLFVYGISLVIIPVLDVFRVFYSRIRDGKSPFKPDRRHIHHKFLAMGFSMRQARWSIFAMSFVFFALNILMSFVLCWNINIIIVIDLVIWVAFNLYISKCVRDRKLRHDAIAEQFEDVGK